jgi:hypothetical protein
VSERQLFHPSSNPLSRFSIWGSILIISAIVWAADLITRSPYHTDQGVIREQPVPFSHQHHVKGLGIDCRYCHTGVEDSAFAGIPPVKTCMSCHSQIWTQAAVLEPVRNSYRTGKPLKWARVNSLPDYVYFDHGIHVNKGVGCVTCHGPVGDMPLSWQQSSLEMKWCLECHRHPERFLRPPSAVFAVDYTPPGDQDAFGLWLVKLHHVKSFTDCYTCHR